MSKWICQNCNSINPEFSGSCHNCHFATNYKSDLDKTGNQTINEIDPIFTKRNQNERYQVRFWSTPQSYGEFTNAVAAEELIIQDVFQEFMKWFVTAHEAGRIKIKNE